MRLSCPACGAEMTLDVLLAHDDARRAIVAAMEISAPLAKRLVAYLGLFRPAQRQLTMDRVAGLLDELLPMLRAQKVKRGQQEYSTVLDTWKQALDTVLAHRDAGTLKLPLKSHGYLLAIVAAMCERFEAGEEERREAARRAAGRDLTQQAAAAVHLTTLTEQAQRREQTHERSQEQPRVPREVPAEFKSAAQAIGMLRRRRTAPADGESSGGGNG